MARSTRTDGKPQIADTRPAEGNSGVAVMFWDGFEIRVSLFRQRKAL